MSFTTKNDGSCPVITTPHDLTNHAHILAASGVASSRPSVAGRTLSDSSLIQLYIHSLQCPCARLGHPADAATTATSFAAAAVVVVVGTATAHGLLGQCTQVREREREKQKGS